MLIHFLIITFYLIVCYAIGHLGAEKKFGFVGNFFASVFLTPLIGLIILIAQHNKASS